MKDRSQGRDPSGVLSEIKLCWLMLKEFHGAATLQKFVTKLSNSKFNTCKILVVRCILGKSKGHVLEIFPVVRPQIPESCSTYPYGIFLFFSINFC